VRERREEQPPQQPERVEQLVLNVVGAWLCMGIWLGLVVIAGCPQAAVVELLERLLRHILSWCVDSVSGD